MTVCPLPRVTQAPDFSSFQQRLQAQLAHDVDVLMTYANLPAPLSDACRYVMSAEGKRVRPLLVAASFASIDKFNKKDTLHNNNIEHTRQSSQPLGEILNDDVRFDMCRRAALAVELLHTYSLVHDDLPCMDDDALRRGQPTAHIVFDEATAMLTGDVLQTLAFEVLTAELPTFAPFDSGISSALIAIFAPRARRMVAGQMLDLNAEASSGITQDALEAIHRDKTGALIEAAMLMGGICAGATALQRMAMQECAQHIGLAFQVQDDILDVTGNTDELGKPAGSDEKLDKSTYVKLMGVAAATDYAQSLFNKGRDLIMQNMADQSHKPVLTEVIDWLWARQK